MVPQITLSVLPLTADQVTKLSACNSPKTIALKCQGPTPMPTVQSALPTVRSALPKVRSALPKVPWWIIFTNWINPDLFEQNCLNKKQQNCFPKPVAVELLTNWKSGLVSLKIFIVSSICFGFSKLCTICTLRVGTLVVTLNLCVSKGYLPRVGTTNSTWLLEQSPPVYFKQAVSLSALVGWMTYCCLI